MCRPTDVVVGGPPVATMVAGVPIPQHATTQTQRVTQQHRPAPFHTGAESCAHTTGGALTFAERYVPVESVGVGSTASVTLAVDTITRQRVALKAVKKSKMSRRKVLQEIKYVCVVRVGVFACQCGVRMVAWDRVRPFGSCQLGGNAYGALRVRAEWRCGVCTLACARILSVHALPSLARTLPCPSSPQHPA